MATDAAPAPLPASSSTAAPSSTRTTTPAATQPAAQRPKRKTKSRRKARRRDGADDDDDASDGDEAGASSAPPSRDPKPSSSSASTAQQPLFPDVSSTTPAVWADSDPKATETVSFDEFTRGATSTSASTPTGAASDSTRGGRGGSAAARGGRGRGGGGGGGRGGHVPTAGTRDANDAESTKRAEERALLKKERQKAKRKEAKEKRQAAAAGKEGAKDRDEDGADAGSVAAAAAAADDDSALAASTSALTLDDAARNRRGSYSQRVAEDPKFTPRVGNFWMHDQRHFEAGNVRDGSFNGVRPVPDHWRGRGVPRGGALRGSFRGGAPRGRGRAFSPFVPSPASVSSNGSHGNHRMTEMDKLELELSRQHRVQPAVSPAASSGKWGHEGFEEQASTEEAFRNNRAVRGRGRAARGLPRGQAPRAFVPAHLPTPEASPDRGVLSIKPTEGTTTQSAADTLLDDSGAVTVRLPGDSEAIEVAVDVESRPAEATAETEASAGDVASTAPAPVAAAHPPAPTSEAATTAPSSGSPFPPVFTPSNPSPVPYVASDSGSISSGYIPPTAAPPLSMAGGEFYPMHSNYRPPPFYPRNFTPQSYTPEPPMQPGMHPQHHQQRPSFSGPASFFPGGAAVRPRSGSPLNPYATGGHMFFVPPHPTSQKVPIRPASGAAAGADGSPRSPTSDATDSNHGHGVPAEGYMPGYYYNPYGMPDGGVFYPPHGGYWPQAGYDGGVAAYGYDGEYHGY